jgi:hypothetical protein
MLWLAGHVSTIHISVYKNAVGWWLARLSMEVLLRWCLHGLGYYCMSSCHY